MRIHAGAFKGHKISRVGIKTTKETASMVREAVFNMIGPITGVALDLFAGSGSYGLTALSLGASHVYLVDSNITAYKTLNANVLKLRANDKVTIQKRDYKQFLKQNTMMFDYIFLDPPFDFSNYEELLNLCYKHLNNEGLIILESNFKTPINTESSPLTLMKMKKYGTKKINVFIKQI